MAFLVNPPCLLYEDDHLLAVNKPPNINTHTPAPWSGEGIYEWLRHQHPRWSALSIIHRLDKETSGVLIFAKSDLARRALTQQFTRRQVEKQYVLVTDRSVKYPRCTARSDVARAGSQYVSRPGSTRDRAAVTHFHRLPQPPPLEANGACPPTQLGHLTALAAFPVTGRTHQVRVHAAQLGFPILGDVAYGGTRARRLFLHAQTLTVRHPATETPLTVSAPADFADPPWLILRRAFLDARATDVCRWIHGAADGWPGWYVDQLGPYLLSQAGQPLTAGQRDLLRRWPAPAGRAPSPVIPRGIYHKTLTRHVRSGTTSGLSPQHLAGDVAPARFLAREHHLQFELSFEEGYSVGLFLDQRENRRRFLTNHVAAGFPLFPDGAPGRAVLNTFAYTCAFSVCAAKAGCLTTNLDLSKKHLDWGRNNFAHNGLDQARHDFICGDVHHWLRRLARKERRFDAVILDPPTFSESKQGGVFRAERDYGKLAAAALPLLAADGVLFASTNAARITPAQFLELLSAVIARAGRRIRQQHYVAQPPDFTVRGGEPGHLKTVWLRVA